MEDVRLGSMILSSAKASKGRKEDMLVFFNINVVGRSRSALVDTGAIDLLMSKKDTEKLGLEIVAAAGKIKTVNAEEVPIVWTVWKIELHIGDWKAKEDFKVIHLDSKFGASRGARMEVPGFLVGKNVTDHKHAIETQEPYAQESAQEVLCTTLGLPKRPLDLARSRELGRRSDEFYLGNLTVGILSRNILWVKIRVNPEDPCNRELWESYKEEM
ncbi:hypothetical protein GQ457_09G029920 [Hibiscus cannabinus]